MEGEGKDELLAMLMSEETRSCGELLEPFLGGDGAVPQAEQNTGVGDDYTDDEIDARELLSLLMDDMISLLENKLKEVVDVAKQGQSQKQLRKRIYRAKGQEVRKARGFLKSAKHSYPRCTNHSLFKVNQP